jgi:hypothetical protein
MEVNESPDTIRPGDELAPGLFWLSSNLSPIPFGCECRALKPVCVDVVESQCEGNHCHSVAVLG